MFVELQACLFDRLVRAAASGRSTHDFFDVNFRSEAVTGRHATAHVTLGDEADQRAAFGVSPGRPGPPCLVACSTKTLRLAS
jgi:hypothetical protein